MPTVDLEQMPPDDQKALRAMVSAAYKYAAKVRRARRVSPVVGALIDGEVSWHGDADPGAGYHTLCGLSLDDDIAKRFEAPPGQKIACDMCRRVWDAARAFRASDFAA